MVKIAGYALFAQPNRLVATALICLFYRILVFESVNLVLRRQEISEVRDTVRAVSIPQQSGPRTHGCVANAATSTILVNSLPLNTP